MSDNALVTAKDPVTRTLALAAVLLALATIVLAILGVLRPTEFGHLTGLNIALASLTVALLVLARTRARRLARNAGQR